MLQTIGSCAGVSVFVDESVRATTFTKPTLRTAELFVKNEFNVVW